MEQAKAAQAKEKRLAEEARTKRNEAKVKAQVLQTALKKDKVDPIEFVHALSAYFNESQEERDQSDTKG